PCARGTPYRRERAAAWGNPNTSGPVAGSRTARPPSAGRVAAQHQGGHREKYGRGPGERGAGTAAAGRLRGGWAVVGVHPQPVHREVGGQRTGVGGTDHREADPARSGGRAQDGRGGPAVDGEVHTGGGPVDRVRVEVPAAGQGQSDRVAGSGPGERGVRVAAGRRTGPELVAP